MKFKVHFAGPEGHMHTVKQSKYKHEICPDNRKYDRADSKPEHNLAPG